MRSRSFPVHIPGRAVTPTCAFPGKVTNCGCRRPMMAATWSCLRPLYRPSRYPRSGDHRFSVNYLWDRPGSVTKGASQIEARGPGRSIAVYCTCNHKVEQDVNLPVSGPYFSTDFVQPVGVARAHPLASTGFRRSLNARAKPTSKLLRRTGSLQMWWMRSRPFWDGTQFTSRKAAGLSHLSAGCGVLPGAATSSSIGILFSLRRWHLSATATWPMPMPLRPCAVRRSRASSQLCPFRRLEKF